MCASLPDTIHIANENAAMFSSLTPTVLFQRILFLITYNACFLSTPTNWAVQTEYITACQLATCNKFQHLFYFFFCTPYANLARKHTAGQ